MRQGYEFKVRAWLFSWVFSPHLARLSDRHVEHGGYVFHGYVRNAPSLDLRSWLCARKCLHKAACRNVLINKVGKPKMSVPAAWPDSSRVISLACVSPCAVADAQEMKEAIKSPTATKMALLSAIQKALAVLSGPVFNRTAFQTRTRSGNDIMSFWMRLRDTVHCRS